MKKIAVLGTGTVGKTLANGFIKHGYEVVIGSREGRQVDGWDKAVETYSNAVIGVDCVVIAVKGMAAESVVKEVAHALTGKIVIDVTNPIREEQLPPVSGVLSFFTTPDESLFERLVEHAPGAYFVKALNSVGSGCMVNPDFNGQRGTMFICGNDQGKEFAREFLGKFGWDVEDLGPPEAARAIEPLCILWCIPGFRNNDWHHAFKMLR